MKGHRIYSTIQGQHCTVLCYMRYITNIYMPQISTLCQVEKLKDFLCEAAYYSVEELFDEA
jgi:hypothetical protein